jgi:hypothetical protein
MTRPDPKRYADLCRKARGYVDDLDDEPKYVIDLCAAVESLALDIAIAQPTLLRANDLRLRLLAACPESAEKIDAVFKAITIPCGPMFERERLERERDEAAEEAKTWRGALVALAVMDTTVPKMNAVLRTLQNQRKPTTKD